MHPVGGNALHSLVRSDIRAWWYTVIHPPTPAWFDNPTQQVLAATARSGSIDIDRDLDRFFRVLLHKYRSEKLWREALNLLHVIRQKGRASHRFTNMVIETCAAAGE